MAATKNNYFVRALSFPFSIAWSFRVSGNSAAADGRVGLREARPAAVRLVALRSPRRYHQGRLLRSVAGLRRI